MEWKNRRQNAVDIKTRLTKKLSRLRRMLNCKKSLGWLDVKGDPSERYWFPRPAEVTALGIPRYTVVRFSKI